MIKVLLVTSKTEGLVIIQKGTRCSWRMITPSKAVRMALALTARGHRYTMQQSSGFTSTLFRIGETRNA